MHPFKLRLSTLITAVVALALLAVAIDWNAQPGVAEAAAPATPRWITSSEPVVSGDGTMKLNWSSATRATGYQYRYSSKAACLSFDVDCVADETAWALATTGNGNTEYTIPKGKLTVGTTYWFQIRAVNNEGTPGNTDDDTYSAPSEIRNALQRAAPAKLANVVATAGNAQVTLSWDNPNDGTIINYSYQRDDGDGKGWGDWQNFTTETDTPNSHTVTDLTNGSTYSFQVRANNNIGPGTASETVTAIPTGPPTAPRDLRATPQNGSVRLHWNDPNDDDIDRYQLRYKSNGDFNTWADIPSSDASTTHYEVPSLANGTEYTFEVRAVDSDRAEGDQAGAASSAAATPTNAARAPSQMSNVQRTVTEVTDGGGGTVTFTWDNPSESFINEYQFRYSESSNSEGFTDWAKIPSSGSSTVTWAPGIHGSSSIVFYELRAVNTTPDPDLEGPETAIPVERSNTPGTSTPPPSAPTGFSATAEWDDTNSHWDVVLSWTDPSEPAIDKYQYRQSTDGGSNWSPDWEDISGSGASTTSHRLNDLAAGTTFTFQIRAVDTDLAGGSGNGASSGAEATTPGAPNAPTGLSATPTDDDTTANVNEAETQVVLAWSAGARITGVVVDDYEYRVRVSGNVSWSEWADTDPVETESVWSYTVPGLLPSTTYEFQVRANAGALNSDPSGSASATTETPAEGIPQPEPPTGLSAGAGNEQVTLTWANPNNEYIRRYRYRQAAGESSATDVETADWQQIDGSDKDTTNHTVTGLDNGTAYSFQVQAEGAGVDNFSGASDTATATPRVPPTQRPSITVAHAVKVPESVSCNDTAWHGPGGAVSSLTIGWSA